MRSPAMIACGLSLAHRAKYGMKKKPFSSIKVLTGDGLSGGAIKKDPEPEMMPTKRALKFRF